MVSRSAESSLHPLQGCLWLLRHHDQDNNISSTALPPFTRQSAVELVIFCGSPGAGKSTFYWDYLEPLGYERVNQDILKTVCWQSDHATR